MKVKEKCRGCEWLYNGFCTCPGYKPCNGDKHAEKEKKDNATDPNK